ncbi:CPBP family intramembrane metalloprotease [Paenibacillus sp. H1-7]|uniref:CPBP family intramembrane glutamic endopeptidase n=1 Tax=Paenibacillus sp. H1-7 TaxID=2282849 RepID=UPI001EF75F17|nr:type II CAAX endopeptidase family protein [Paenibacillus sp. H1-7]ULL18191.1 CPBP family intramembrane metalloprotease [Paenibacillus sp. H1-7]
MLKRYFESSLLKLALIGILLYVSVALGSLWLQHARNEPDLGSQQPSVTKQAAAEAAVRFVRERFSLSPDYRTSTLFQSHTERSGYLQKEQLLDDYLKRFADYPIDYFEVEINDPASRTTYYIDVNFTNLHILGWNAYTSPSAKQQTVASGSADTRALIEQTIKEQGYSIGEFTRLEQTPQDRRSEGVWGAEIIYESIDKKIGESTLQLQLAVAGGKVVSFHPAFSIPASFAEWQEKQNDNASFMTRISMGVSLIMAVAAFIIVIRYRKEITFRRGLFMTFVFLAIYIGNNFNMVPAFRTMHSEGPSQWEAMFNLWFLNVFIALMAVSVYFSFLSGRYMWQRLGWVTWPVWKDATFGHQMAVATSRGYLLCLFILGIQQSLFFVAGEYFDVWAVNDPSDSVLNMAAPAFFPLMAWAAAISEEAVYRLFGIAFFMKLTRNRFAAVLLPSMIWALSHTQYPIYPVYTRFIEVTIIGIIFGYAFLKYGFLTVMLAHAAMDSILMGLSLLDSGSTAITAVGLFYIVLPALIGWAVAWLHRTIGPGRRIVSPELNG